MKNIKLTIAYDGSGFHGWQFQPGVPTIQGALNDAAGKITQERIVVHGASRTDTGVHALGQVAHFRTHSSLSAAELQRALNALLPPAIRIMAAEEAGMDFHARWQSLAKTYRYRIWRARVLPPFEYGRALHHPWPLDLDAMARAAPLFQGVHDFTSFAASSGLEETAADRADDRAEGSDRADTHRSGPNTTREIFSSQLLVESQDEIAYLVRGRSFLRYMVRKIVGTLLEVGRARISPADIPRLFELRDRSRSGPTVPPEGLYLVSLEHPDPAHSLAANARPRSSLTDPG